MTGPSFTPRGEYTPAPGANWEAQLILHGEILVDTSGDLPVFVDRELPTTSPVDHNEPQPPRPNRATRRAMQRAARRNK
jgi:hypothetical protein